MASQAPRQRGRYEPLYDINPRTGVSIEVFYIGPHAGNVRSMWRWLVLVASPAWPLARGGSHGAICYELRSVSACLGDQFGGRSQFRSKYCNQFRSLTCFHGGESGIRTHGTVSRTHAFQACALSHSAISPDALS